MGFNQINEAFKHRLPSTEKLVLLCLARYANSKTGQCWPSNKQLGVDTGFAPETVSRAIKKLSERNLLTVTRRYNRSSVITLVDRIEDQPISVI